MTVLGGETMGTGWRVRLVLPPRLDVAAVHAAIAARLAGLVAEMSHWAPESLLSRFNRGVAGSWWSLPPDFATVIAAGLEVAARTDGAFDPALGALVDACGYGPQGMSARTDAAAAHAVSGWWRLTFDPAARRLRQPGGCALDLSGIAKGHAVDAVAALLGGMGVAHALVEIGGELRGFGVRPDLEPWWVALETPPGVAAAPIRIALHALSVATSGDYVRGAHTIDGRSGQPVSAAVAISVLHPSAMLADAWASALTVLGPGEGQATAMREALAVRAIWRTAAGPVEWISPALVAMMV